MAEPLTPTQADRDAAADLCNRFRLQNADCHALVQAFALHASRARIAALEEAARVAINHSNYGHEEGNKRAFRIARDLVGRATSIRATLSTPQEQEPTGDVCGDGDGLAGISELAVIAGVTKQAVSQWQTRHADFPTPIAKLKQGPIYSIVDFRRWWASRSAKQVRNTPSPSDPGESL